MSFYLYSGIAALMYSLFAGAKYYSMTGEGLISTQEAKNMIKSGKIKDVVDVRTRIEYNSGHYKGAKHIPVTEISPSKVKNLGPGVLVYCNTGQRARRAAEILREYGVKDVFYIESRLT